MSIDTFVLLFVWKIFLCSEEQKQKKDIFFLNWTRFLQPWATWMASVFTAERFAWLCQSTQQCSCPEKVMRTRASPRITATPPCIASRSLAPKTTPTSSHPLRRSTSPTSRKLSARKCPELGFYRWWSDRTFGNGPDPVVSNSIEIGCCIQVGNRVFILFS